MYLSTPGHNPAYHAWPIEQPSLKASLPLIMHTVQDIVVIAQT